MPGKHTVFSVVRTFASLLRQSTAPLRVLVVDDDAQVRTFVERVLRDAGYVVTAVGSGAEALDRFVPSVSFAFAVVDVRMKRMSGPTLVQHLRQGDPALKVLYLTAYNDQLFREKAVLWEDEAFLDKPCTVKGLLEAASLLLYGHFRPTSVPA